MENNENMMSQSIIICPKRYENFKNTFVNVLDVLMHQGKLKFYALIIKPTLIKILLKTL